MKKKLLKEHSSQDLTNEARTVDIKKQRLNEALKSLLTEDDSVEQADPVTMFQDFSDVTGQLADIYSTLVNYQTSYVQNPKVQQAIATIMNGVQTLIKQSTQTMGMLGQGFGLSESKTKKTK
jgi:hypothetical protein